MEALLAAIYPPQRAPPGKFLFEVCEIAYQFKMEPLLQKLKTGLVSRGDIGILLEGLAEAERKGVHPVDAIPEIVVEAFAEFKGKDFSGLRGYDKLADEVKLRISQKREAILENLLRTHPNMKAEREACKLTLFKPVPEDEKEDVGAMGERGIGAVVALGRLMRGASGRSRGRTRSGEEAVRENGG